MKTGHIILCLWVGVLTMAWSADVDGADKDRYLTGKQAYHEPRDRDVDVEHLDLKVEVDLRRGRVQGTATVRGTLSPGATEVILHGVDLTIDKAHWVDGSKPEKASWRGDGQRLRFARDATSKRSFALRMTYRATPRKGLYFVLPTSDTAKRPVHVFSQGETEEARHWIPCPDDPDERMTWNIEVTVARDLVVLSNGRKTRSVVKGPLRTTGYRVDQPYPIYLLNLAIGPYVEVVHRKGKVRLSSWCFQNDRQQVASISERLPDMLDFFNKALGVEYPFSSYSHVYVHDFGWGGMENITLTTLTHRAIGDRRTVLDRTIDGLLAHEIAHQWFGDLVTCRTWAEIWLNEGFATYFEKLWAEHAFGTERFAEKMAGARRGALEQDGRYLRAIVQDRYTDAGELFDGHSYSKGAWMLHMLRHRLGRKAFLGGISSYLRQHRLGSVETVDLRQALERSSKRSLRGFFERWIHQPGHPELYVNIQYLATDKRLRIRFEQRQRVSAQMPLFELPIEVAIRSTRTAKPSLHRYLLKARNGELSLPMKQRPDLVEIDPNMGLFAKWRIKAGVDMLANMARDGRHPDVRLRAVRSLKYELRSSRAVLALLGVLRSDKARHVRAAAAKTLEQAPRKAARAGLLRALAKDPEAMVRRAAARTLGTLHDEQSWKPLERSARGDRSYATVRASLKALATIDRQRARPILVKATGWSSYRHGVAIEALSLLGRIADGRDLKRIWTATGRASPQALRRGAVAALAAFGVRREASREAIREHLEGLLHDNSMRTRRSVANALHALDDPASRSALLGAAGRESNGRLAQNMKRWAAALGKGMSADKRLRRIEETLERLQREGRGEEKGGDRGRDGHQGHRPDDRGGEHKDGRRDEHGKKRRGGQDRPS